MLKASIIIPCFNGGDLLIKCLKACQDQICNFKSEIILIDSGSNDGSWEQVLKIAQYDPRIKTEAITPTEFGHGKTRNLAASRAQGEYLVFLTQDAIPCDLYHLQNLVNAMERHPKSAGGFGPHLAHSHHSIYTNKCLADTFGQFGPSEIEFKINQTPFSELPVQEQRFYRFFSDNNSILRKSIWVEIPYDDVDFGEDQIWAQKVLMAGYGKLFIPDAPVFHSHQFGMITNYRRASTEGYFMARAFQDFGPAKITKLPARIIKTATKEVNFWRAQSQHKNMIRTIIEASLHSIATNTGRMLGNLKGLLQK